MDLGSAFSAIGEGDRPVSFEQFRESLDPEWIDQALLATGTATMRRRRLPAENAVWLLIGMALFRDRPILAVAHHLGLVLPGTAFTSQPLTSSAIVKARDRLGSEPLESLFEATATRWAKTSAEAHCWRGLALYGVDGSTLRI